MAEYYGGARMVHESSTERGKDGDIRKSLNINAERFGISKQMRQILNNTINYLEW